MVKPLPFRAHDPLFDDAWLKWGWAVNQAELLKTELRRALETEVKEMFTTETQYHPKLHGFCMTIASIDRAPETWGIKIGSVLHGYASALDNAAWAVYQRGARPTLDKWARRKVAFPLHEDPLVPFKANEKVPGATTADLAVINWAQPYHFPKTKRARHVLPLLVEKNNIDKHKTLQPVLLGGVKYFPAEALCVDCTITRVTPSKRHTLQVGTELARVYVRKTGPNPDIQMNGHLATSIFLDENVSVENFLNDTRDWVSNVLRGFSNCPLDLSQRLGFSE